MEVPDLKYMSISLMKIVESLEFLFNLGLIYDILQNCPYYLQNFSL
jgi:hypothetical protein